jgi:hypothetical protein
LRVNAEQEAGIHAPSGMYRLWPEIVQVERLKKVRISRHPGCRRKRHAQALVNSIEVAEPQPAGARAVRVISYVDQEAR